VVTHLRPLVILRCILCLHHPYELEDTIDAVPPREVEGSVIVWEVTPMTCRRGSRFVPMPVVAEGEVDVRGEEA
jgi:hypothetical protein